MTLKAAIEEAASSLPEGWSIHITVELGAGWVRLEDPKGVTVELYRDEMDFADQICAGIKLAHETERQ
jgi:hypothetical protein